MPSLKRAVLDTLDKKTLVELSKTFGFTGSQVLNKDELIDNLAQKRSISLEDLFTQLYYGRQNQTVTIKNPDIKGLNNSANHSLENDRIVNRDINIPLRSPLRYPGGKAFLCSYMERLLLTNRLKPNIFIEPFAGGASISLYLLGKELVNKIALFDLDPLVTGFWRTVFNNKDWLLEKLLNTKVTVENWKKLKATELDGHKSNGWKCLFLNRTSFSGILASRVGPIGGTQQKSKYKIDCRFYRETIHSRIEDLWKYRDRVDAIETLDWSDTIARYLPLSKNNPQSYFLYLDPPFFHKAERLYNHVFANDEHEALIRSIVDLEIPWLLSYDNCPEALILFKKFGLNYRTVKVRYTSSKQINQNIKEELVASNKKLPKE